MGTRAVYTFKDEYNTHHVFKHWDGYPEGAIHFLQKAKKLAWKLPRFEADEFGGAFIAANKTPRKSGFKAIRYKNIHNDFIDELEKKYPCDWEEDDDTGRLVPDKL